MTERSLSQWLAYLEQLHPAAIDMGLDRCREVAQRLGLGKPAERVVTVTGTNGKGSTCAYIAALMQDRELKVGVYASPHLLRYNERVVIDGQQATDAQLCEAFTAVEAARGATTLTYFEMGTLAAFWLFQRAELDAVVLEVGLGGRLDAVNLVDADLAVITSIGLDHAEYLGDTRESVAFEKAGILRAGVPALCGDIDPPQPLLDQVATLGCPLYLRGRDYDFTEHDDHWSWRGVDVEGYPVELLSLPLPSLPLENAALALQVYVALDLPRDAGRIGWALAHTRVAGRLDRHRVNVAGKTLDILLDVGHNPHAARFLAERLAGQPLTGRRLAVFGLLADKDLAGVVEPLAPVIAEWAVAPLKTPRTRPAAELNAALLNLGATTTSHASLADALEAQCEAAGEGDEILVFGSFHCVAQALKWMYGNVERESVDGIAQ
ncbi:bifunctional tetrahydrofolate synthase/dihydrofolate synthase [Pseudomonas coleopterorum]|uniref:bifunctional tetrahydrofolate synthase/dihydrofolate synthase n=1 Tax=Pseudomonas coleopterorum TaxID=1605838 RepID=UPI000898A3BB|nr:bifunctional tetrahydrofolate synthase/dihydrofolate synthase [Pseudomonas coleopterorum]SEE53699.1 dihydrofolate synthase / folylpolyglutamate synthase [Pseudomonas coleopterorum]